MVSANPEHTAADSRDSRLEFPGSRTVTASESIASQRLVLPPEMSWFDRRTPFREPEWFDLPDEFE